MPPERLMYTVSTREGLQEPYQFFMRLYLNMLAFTTAILPRFAGTALAEQTEVCKKGMEAVLWALARSPLPDWNYLTPHFMPPARPRNQMQFCRQLKHWLFEAVRDYLRRLSDPHSAPQEQNSWVFMAVERFLEPLEFVVNQLQNDPDVRWNPLQ